ncbi:DUF3040 domain-containing protein [Arthrobacter sp. SIMBA_036]|uniref:DUF3040 domain-containing protein n=1 Tax=Arthrobacter sp. SIMBA_036 TaxID=3085778 RepID=UPI0039786504
MPLSEREQRVLQRLERELFIQDPRLARQLESGIPVRGPIQPRLRDVLAAAGALVLILLAIPLHAFLLAVAGLLLLFSAVRADRAHRARVARISVDRGRPS